MENTTSTTPAAPALLGSISTEDNSQIISFFDNEAITIEEFNGDGERTTFICLNKFAVMCLKTALATVDEILAGK